MREKKPDNLQTDAVKSTWPYCRPKQQESRGVQLRVFLAIILV